MHSSVGAELELGLDWRGLCGRCSCPVTGASTLGLVGLNCVVDLIDRRDYERMHLRMVIM